jgi:hypothetical protein
LQPTLDNDSAAGHGQGGERATDGLHLGGVTPPAEKVI